MQPITGAQNTVALYARVSTDEQREGQTIQSQLAELEKFADQNGWTIHSRYLDESWSGALLARPELDRLRDDAGRGFFGMVLVNDVDRLARDVAHLGVIKRDLERNGVRLVFRKLPTTADPMNNFMINILGSFAEFEREMIADRTRRGMRHKVEARKEYVGCIAPYGYRYIPKAFSNDIGILEINPDEAPFAKQMFQWVAEEGLSIQKVADRLTRLKVPTRRGGAAWRGCSVYKILRNEAYCGIWSYGKVEACEPVHPRNTSPYRRKRTSRRQKPKSEWLRIDLPEHLRLIDRELWEAAQKQISTNPRFSPRNAKYQYLLQGLLRCDSCKSVVSGTYSRNRRKVTTYYRCRNCSRVGYMRTVDIEPTIWKTVKEALLNPQYLKSRIKRAQERIAEHGQTIEQRQKDLSLQQIENIEFTLLKNYQTGGLSAQLLHKELERIRQMRTDIINRPSETELPQEQVHSTVESYCNRIHNRLRDATFDTKQKILRHLIDEIFVTDESARILGVLRPEPAERPLSSQLASPRRPERICNYGEIRFELVVKLHSHTRLRRNRGVVNKS